MQGMKSLEEVAIEYRVTKRTVRNWIAKGLVVAYRRNNQAIYIDERSLDGMFSLIRGAK
jgi:DNA-binding transcriptional MerR regulator